MINIKAIKKINNNVVLVKLDDGKEAFVLGKGVGFKKTPYDIEQNDPVIEKIFIQNDVNTNRYIEIFNQIKMPVIMVTEDIISKGKSMLSTDLSETLLFTLADHINNAIQRPNQTDELVNTLHYEVKHIYPTENKIGEYAIEEISKKLNIKLPQEESSLIALHFVNAQLKSNDFSETSKITQIIKDIITIVKYNMKSEIDENSINFSRFVTHLRYFIIRQINGESLNEKNDLYEVVSKTAEKELGCLKKICEYLEVNHQWNVTTDEQLYLLLHLKRI